jgi:hypothetical protein
VLEVGGEDDEGDPLVSDMRFGTLLLEGEREEIGRGSNVISMLWLTVRQHVSSTWRAT